MNTQEIYGPRAHPASSVDTALSHWHAMYERLCLFKEKNNHCNVPRSKDKSLAGWVCTQRKCYKHGKLSPDKITLLNSIEFEWAPLDAPWHERYKALKALKEKNKQYERSQLYQGKLLKHWVSNQKAAYKNGRLSQDKIALLESIGFTWRTHDAQWDYSYKKLQVFKEQNNHCNVPSLKDKSLQYWIQKQRKTYRHGRLSKNKIALLESIGFKFKWDQHVLNWEYHYKALKAFKDENNHCNVSLSCKNKAFVGWVYRQRYDYQHGQLSQNKILLLESLGLEWYPLDARWNNAYEALKAFKKNNNHCNVPLSKDALLARWVWTQRQFYKHGKLSKEKIELLENLGFQWRATAFSD